MCFILILMGAENIFILDYVWGGMLRDTLSKAAPCSLDKRTNKFLAQRCPTGQKGLLYE